MKKSSISIKQLSANAFITLLLIPAMSFADDVGFDQKNGGACKFVTQINTILNLVSVSVVTIAIIFAGYQIAFAHKRVSDVAPIFIGGLLIGAAGQIAKMLIQNKDTCTAAADTLLQFMQHLA